jgi:hypothetical protein
VCGSSIVRERQRGRACGGTIPSRQDTNERSGVGRATGPRTLAALDRRCWDGRTHQQRNDWHQHQQRQPQASITRELMLMVLVLVLTRPSRLLVSVTCRVPTLYTASVRSLVAPPSWSRHAYCPARASTCQLSPRPPEAPRGRRSRAFRTSVRTLAHTRAAMMARLLNTQE